jgi:CRISPR/Cas system CSM-associated protein Csm3 (group 7 of RAMP superfamily)
MGTMKISYTIKFLSDWHAGSGLSSGAEADSSVIKCSKNLPYLPGKTIKGLFKDALLDIGVIEKSTIDRLLGYELKQGEKLVSTIPGSLFFSNATLEREVSNEISYEMSNFLYRNQASTCINNKGIASSGSLRTIQVCIPVTLEGFIDGVNDDDVKFIEKAFKYIRHVGVNRNRGLGRCQFKIKLK